MLRSSPAAVLICCAATLVPVRATAVSLAVAHVEGVRGATVQVTVGIETDGLQLGSVQNDIIFDYPNLSLNFRGAVPDCSLAAGIGRQLDVRLADEAGRLRASVVPLFPSGPIADGPLYFCGFTVSPGAPTGIYPLVVSALSVELQDGSPVPTPTADDGSITVRAAAPVVLAVGEESGVPGGLVVVPVRIETKGRRVAATANEIEFDTTMVRLHRDRAQPDCKVNPLLGKLLSVFVPADGDSVLVQVLPEPGVDPMPDGELYRCAFEINPKAPPGRVTLRALNVTASDPEGVALVGVVGSDGAVVVDGQNSCPGDCDDDGEVTMADLTRAVNIALGLREVESCRSLDRDSDETVTVDELIAAVLLALNGC